MPNLSRRTIIATGAAAGGLVLSGPWLHALAETEQCLPDQAPESALHVIRASDFRLAISGLTEQLIGLSGISGGKLTMDIRVNRRGKPGHQLSYGDPHWENISLVVAEGEGAQMLQGWADAASVSSKARRESARDIRLYLLSSDKTAVQRTINMFGCYPVSLDAGAHDTGSDIKTIVFTCNVDRIEEAKG